MRWVREEDKPLGACMEQWQLLHWNGETWVFLLPGYHPEKGKQTKNECVAEEHSPFASLEIIAGEEIWRRQYPADSFRAYDHRFGVKIEDSIFSARGCRLEIREEAMEAQGELRYRAGVHLADSFSALRATFSRQKHLRLMRPPYQVNGELVINGVLYRFVKGTGLLVRNHSYHL